MQLAPLREFLESECSGVVTLVQVALSCWCVSNASCFVFLRFLIDNGDSFVSHQICFVNAGER